MKKIFFVLSLLIKTLVVQGADLPDLGDVASDALSPRQETTLGKRLYQRVFWQSDAALHDDEINLYLTALGERLVAASARPELTFRFFVLHDNSINAMALPGGYIGVHVGLILAAERESELASVLGHEISHVTQRHIAQLFSKRGQSHALMLGSMLIAALAMKHDPQLGQAAMVAGQAGAMQQQINYTRGFEREADRLGLQALAKAGFDIGAMADFFKRMYRLTRTSAAQSVPAYLRTHPLTRERISDIENRVAQMSRHRVPPSVPFQWMKTKLQVLQKSPAEAVSYFEAKLPAATALDKNRIRYGLAHALLRHGQAKKAARYFAQIQPKPDLPFLYTLEADIALAQHHNAQALHVLEQGLSRFPQDRALKYALLDAQIRTDQAAEAVKVARAAVTLHPDDNRLWTLLAKGYQRLDHLAEYHRAQAEVYALQGRLAAALEQLEAARDTGQADFYTLSAIDARIKALQRDISEEDATAR